MHDGIERTKDVELLNCKSGAEYLLSKLRAATASAKATQELWKKQTGDDDCEWDSVDFTSNFVLFVATTFPFLNECITLAHCMVDVVVHGKATSNLVQDVDQSAILADGCRDVTLQCIDLYSNYQTCASTLVEFDWGFRLIVLASGNTDLDKPSNELIRHLNTLIEKATALLPKVKHLRSKVMKTTFRADFRARISVEKSWVIWSRRNCNPRTRRSTKQFDSSR